MLKRLVAIACMAGFALVNPLPAAAADSFTCSVSPATGGTWTTLSCSMTVAKIISREEMVVPGSFCHYTDASCSPPSGTPIGTMSIRGNWVFLFCGSGTQTFTADWVAPDGAYTPPSGWSVVAQINHVNSLATIKAYIIENSSGQYKVEWPSWPTLTCSGHTMTIDFAWGAYNGTTYHIYMTPSGAGTYTISDNLTFTDNSTESLNTTYTIT